MSAARPARSLLVFALALALAVLTPAFAATDYKSELIMQGPQWSSEQAQAQAAYVVPKGQCSALLPLHTADLCGEGVRPLGFAVTVWDAAHVVTLRVDAAWAAVSLWRLRVAGACPSVLAHVVARAHCPRLVPPRSAARRAYPTRRALLPALPDQLDDEE